MSIAAAFKTAALVYAKDLRLEARRKRSVAVAILFSSLIVVLGSFGFYISNANNNLIVPGLMWISIAFAGLLIMTESWICEREFESFRLLQNAAPSLSGVFFGKMLACTTLIAAIVLWVCFLLELFFQVPLSAHVVQLAPVALAGIVSFAATGTLFSSLAMHGNYRESFLGVLLFPLISPGLIAAVVATREILSNNAPDVVTSWIGLLCAFAVLSITVSAILFERLADR